MLHSTDIWLNAEFKPLPDLFRNWCLFLSKRTLALSYEEIYACTCRLYECSLYHVSRITVGQRYLTAHDPLGHIFQEPLVALYNLTQKYDTSGAQCYSETVFSRDRILPPFNISSLFFPVLYITFQPVPVKCPCAINAKPLLLPGARINIELGYL